MPSGQISQPSPFQPGWTADFSLERDRPRAAFGRSALEIEHIGSTSVEHLASKPIIDLAILIERQKEADQLTQLRAGLGHQIVPSLFSGIPERYLWIQGEPVKYPLSIAFPGVGDFQQRQILFRDSLRANPAVREEYPDSRGSCCADIRTRGETGVRPATLRRRRSYPGS